jgi:hypothetical protein
MEKRQKESEKPLSQIDRFKEAARELGTDDSEEAFDEKLKKIAKAPPPNDKPKAAAK